ncbi:MAG TPA: response regulator, partial [Thermoleophilia bacterium]|nr:response regulator [Thermoleophilia bacterium]
LQMILGRVSLMVDNDPALSETQRAELEAVMEACECGARLSGRVMALAAEAHGTQGASVQSGGRVSTAPVPRTVLVIDDHPAVAGLVCDILQRLGHSALKTTDPAEGLALFAARADEIDIVMLDWIMPGIGGGAVISAVREVKPRARIIVSSGHPLDADTRATLEAMGVLLVPKPATLEALANAIGG